MYEHKLARPFHCPVTVTLEVLGGKWKVCLLYGLKHGLHRPSDLHRAVPSASRRVLNQQLRELERHGMVGKTVFPELPLRVEYYLTEAGQTLLGVIDAMADWGETHGEAFRKKMAQQYSANPAPQPTA